MQIIGHRGAMGLAPENSLEGFELAIKHKVDVIELDVRLTNDDQLVVIHDADLKRLADKDVEVKELSLADIESTSRIDGSKFVSLDSVLTAINTRCRVNIEIKDRSSTVALQDVLARHQGISLMVSSFLLGELVDIHRELPSVDTALLRRWVPLVSKRTIRRAGLQYFGMKKVIARKWAIKRAKNQGLSTYAYATDDEKELARFERFGLDGIVRNKP